MGFSRRRADRDGKIRYTAYYTDLRGRQRSAGTFSNKKQADKAWQGAETRIESGRIGDPRRGKQTFERYVRDTWLPNHVMEITTRERYTGCLEKHIIPWFGPMKMVEVLPSDVREWVTSQTDLGVSPGTIKKNMTVLNAVFTTALNDQITFLHPCQGVKTPAVPVRGVSVVTPEQFDLIYTALSDVDSQLLVELDIETGCRWGELTELRPQDFDFRTGILTISRVVIEVSPKHHPTGGRFLVKDYPKDGEDRRFKVRREVLTRIEERIRQRGLGPDDLLFTFRQPTGPKQLVPPPECADLGLTEPNEKGRQYRHGTITAYSMAKCRCRNCKSAYAVYRAERRAAGKDKPKGLRTVDTDGHIPRNWFRNQVWKPALNTAGIESATVRSLRGSHASWLLRGGADLQVVKERLGHASIVTTQRYLRALPDADETALNALGNVRRVRPA
jgi:integrase